MTALMDAEIPMSALSWAIFSQRSSTHSAMHKISARLSSDPSDAGVMRLVRASAVLRVDRFRHGAMLAQRCFVGSTTNLMGSRVMSRSEYVLSRVPRPISRLGPDIHPLRCALSDHLALIGSSPTKVPRNSRVTHSDCVPYVRRPEGVRPNHSLPWKELSSRFVRRY